MQRDGTWGTLEEHQKQWPSGFSTPPSPLFHTFSHQRAEGRPTNCKRKQCPMRRTVFIPNRNRNPNRNPIPNPVDSCASESGESSSGWQKEKLQVSSQWIAANLSERLRVTFEFSHLFSQVTCQGAEVTFRTTWLIKGQSSSVKVSE